MGFVGYAASALVLVGGLVYWLRERAPIVQPTLAALSAIMFGALVCAAMLAALYVARAPTDSAQHRGLYTLMATGVGFAFGATMGAVVAAPIWLLGVLAMRKGGAPRPLGDITIGLGAVFASLATIWRPLGLAAFAAGHPPWHWAAAALGGLVAGLVYWLLAGRPHAPYDG